MDNDSKYWESSLKTLLTQITEATILAGSDGNITFINSAAEDLLKTRFQLVSGKNIFHVIKFHKTDGLKDFTYLLETLEKQEAISGSATLDISTSKGQIIE
jgi:PAS domain-containing protein